MLANQDQGETKPSASLLVVQEDSNLLSAIQGILASAGYKVITASSGADALDLLHDRTPDLILSDAVISDMDAFDLLEAIRKRSGQQNVPFVLLTPADRGDAVTAGRPLQPDATIEKPITSKELLAVIEARVKGAGKDLPTRALDGDGVTLLVVEDDLAMLVALRDILAGAGYSVITASNGEAALKLYREQVPDLILSDISMPVMDGIALFEAVRKEPGGKAIPFIFLTARGTREDILAGMSLGADDYITKPITSQELLRAVRARLKRADELLFAQLKIAYKASLLALANAIEARDQYTHDHVLRINAYSQAIAQELGWNEARCEILEFAAILHDIGKLDVPVDILTKDGPLTEEEWDHMRRHPIDGAHMIEGIDYLEPAVPIVLHHHERWDGAGYPSGLQGEQIPIEARLLAVADTFDAMTSNRPYRAAFEPEAAYEEILMGSGKQFDPEMVAIFQRCWEKGDVHRILTENTDRER
jgi:putative two-component system response regulator